MISQNYKKVLLATAICALSVSNVHAGWFDWMPRWKSSPSISVPKFNWKPNWFDGQLELPSKQVISAIIVGIAGCVGAGYAYWSYRKNKALRNQKKIQAEAEQRKARELRLIQKLEESYRKEKKEWEDKIIDAARKNNLRRVLELAPLQPGGLHNITHRRGQSILYMAANNDHANKKDIAGLLGKKIAFFSGTRKKAAPHKRL